MTVTYASTVSTVSSYRFLRLLVRWKGSIYKLVWRELLVFMIMYYSLSITYRLALNEEQREIFQNIRNYCNSFAEVNPVAFVLGFYVSIVVGRWWDMFVLIPHPSRMAVYVSTLVNGHDERARLMRRTIVRYLVLTNVMTMASISPPIKKRFPTLDELTSAGFLLANEQISMENIPTRANKYFIPLIWAAAVVSRARKEGYIRDDFAVKTLIDEINNHRSKCSSLFGYDWVTIPLAYTQVVTICVYTFFISTIMGRQFIGQTEGVKATYGDMYFPFFTFLQFLVYSGWLKVSQAMLNPFGEDDDDFDLNSLIDSQLKNAYLVVDELHNHKPHLVKDQYWDNLDFEVPYNRESQMFHKPEYLGSTADKEPSRKSVTVRDDRRSMSVPESGARNAHLTVKEEHRV